MAQLVVKLTAEARREMAAAEKRGANVQAAIVRGMETGGQEVANKIVTDRLTGQVLNVRTGELRKSVESRVLRRGASVTSLVGVRKGPATAYARILNDGGKITAKGGALAIPLEAAKTPGGVPRFPGGPRTVPDLFMIKRAGRPPLLARAIRGGKAIEPMYVLKRSVTIKATDWLSGGVRKYLGLYTDEINEELDGVE